MNVKKQKPLTQAILFSIRNTGKETVILEGNVEDTIIADWLEANIDYHNATIVVNTHRIDEGLGIVGISVVMSTAKRMALLVTKVQKRN